MSELLYVRHGQASYGSANYDQLSKLGYEQCRQLGRYLLKKEHRFDCLYVGPLKRHHQSLEMIQEEYDKAGVPLPDPIELAELDEHKGPDVLRQLLPQLRKEDPYIAKWQEEIDKDSSLKIKNGLLIFDRAMALWAEGELDDKHPPEHMKWPDFRQVVERGMDFILDRHHTEKGKKVGAFTSGGTISATIGKVMNIPNHSRVISLNGIVQNASMTEVVFSGKRVTLKSFNKVPHLPDEMLTYV